MLEPKFEKILIKYLNNSIQIQELDELNIWIKKHGNEAIFKSFIKTNYVLTMSANDSDLTELNKILLKRIKTDKNIFYQRRIRVFLKNAAVILLFIGLGYFIQQSFFNGEINLAKSSIEKKIVLELEDDEIIELSESGFSNITDSKGDILGIQKGAKIKYKSPLQPNKLAYHTLKVPYGKRYNIELSDGTEVYLNSGSSLKYPTQFVQGTDRQVFLEGEAFFEVSHDIEHPFLVFTNEINIQVLGTKFNVSNYADEHNTDVVLTSGSVAINHLGINKEEKKEVLLKPGFKGAFNRTEKTISIEKVDTTVYTSWMNGSLIFKNESFRNIMKTLERQYDVIIIVNKQEEKETFNTIIEVEKETIEEVLNYFKKIHNIEYQIINNKIVIN
ncbi:FecR family protein [Maribacter sp.]|uniref:FecR family protein n=1 Tax=Maribacter sp. TaxID=1897614 RepID=UPI0025B8EF97|nr:FecR family protein [Maribacter sp.]